MMGFVLQLISLGRLDFQAALYSLVYGFNFITSYSSKRSSIPTSLVKNNALASDFKAFASRIYNYL